MRKQVAIAFAIGCVSGSVSCEGGGGATNGEQPHLRADPPPVELVLKGKRMVRRGPARLREGVSGTLTPSTPASSDLAPPSADEALRVDQLSIGDLAQAMRLVTVYDGYEYIQSEADLDLAAKVRANRGLEISRPPGGPHVSPGTGQPSADERSVGRSVIDNDDRFIVSNNTALPNNSLLALNFVNSGCSAVSIGDHTAISAAHCFYENGTWSNFDPGNPGNPSFIAPGANVGMAPPNDFPWGKFTCYGVWFYSAWLEEDGHYWDFALMDFSGCPDSNNAAWAAGYTGTWVNKYVSPVPNDTQMSVFGYPGFCPGIVGWPQLCGMTSGAFSGGDGEPHYLLTTQIDTSGGESGTSWTWTDTSNGWFYTLGTHIGDWGAYPWQDTTNYARRLDSQYWSLVTGVSVDF